MLKRTQVVRSVFLRCVFLVAGIVLLVACAPVQPDSSVGTTVPDATATTEVQQEPKEPVEPQPDVAADGMEFTNEEPCSSLFDLNLAHTSEALHSSTFWTWHINFNKTSLGGAAPDFYGCLHYYWRANTDPTTLFVPADAYILTPCTTVGVLDAEFEPRLETSQWVSTKNAMGVYFSDGNYIECSLDLGAAGAKYVGEMPLQDETDVVAASLSEDAQVVFTSIMDELVDLGSVQTYNTFSMAGATGPFELSQADLDAATATGIPAPTLPIAFYRPICADPTDCAPPVSLAHAAYTDGLPERIAPFGEVLGNQYTVNPGAPCADASDTCFIENPIVQPNDLLFRLYSVMEYGEALPFSAVNDPCIVATMGTGQPQYFTFRYRYFGTGHSFAWQHLCPQDILPGVLEPAPTHLQAGVDFWTGPATIYIGHNPVSGEFYNGYMYEVWVDPDATNSITE